MTNPAPSTPHPNGKRSRRYDVDWLRVIALLLLVLFHAYGLSINFYKQSNEWTFLTHDDVLLWLRPIIALMNVWRIPILFVISGMGVRFAMERRDWRALAADRLFRLGVPFVFGYAVINPIVIYIMQLHYGWPIRFQPNASHLWFLYHILAYFIVASPLLWYLKHNPENKLFVGLRWLFAQPYGLFVLVAPFVLEVIVLNLDAVMYPQYKGTVHAGLLGFICFLVGFLFIALSDVFFVAVVRARWPALLVAVVLYVLRVFVVDTYWSALIAVESYCWMLALFGFGALYLNRPSRVLRYLSSAVYPVYIVHFPVQVVLAYLLVQRIDVVDMTFLLMVPLSYGISFLLYEVIRRLRWIRPLFGMRFSSAETPTKLTQTQRLRG